MHSFTDSSLNMYDFSSFSVFIKLITAYDIGFGHELFLYFNYISMLALSCINVLS